MLALRGYEPLAPTPDLIGFLSSQRKTGVLEVVTPHEVFVLEMDQGDIAHARSDSTPPGQRLGDILVAYGMIGRDAIEESMRRFPLARLGEALLQAGLVDNEQLLQAVRIQIQQLFNRLFEAKVTRFTYWNGPPIHTEQRVRLNAISLLLEGARVTDEAKKNNWFWKMA